MYKISKIAHMIKTLQQIETSFISYQQHAQIITITIFSLKS